MKLKFVRLNLQEILIIPDVPIGLGQDERPLGAIHEHNKTIFLKRGGYYDEELCDNYDNNMIFEVVLDQIQIYMGCDISKWEVRHSPDSFGLSEWSEFSQSHESLGEISYRNLPQREKDARKVDTNTLPVEESH